MKAEESLRNLSRRTALASLGAALTMPLAWAQQGDANWQRIVAAAKQEGSLVIYHQAVPQVLDRDRKSTRLNSSHQ